MLLCGRLQSGATRFGPKSPLTRSGGLQSEDLQSGGLQSGNLQSGSLQSGGLHSGSLQSGSLQSWKSMPLCSRLHFFDISACFTKRRFIVEAKSANGCRVTRVSYRIQSELRDLDPVPHSLVL